MIRRPSPSMIVALIALAVALSGVAYAALELPANSVKSRHIASGQVKSPDVRNNGITGRDVKEQSLKGLPPDPRLLSSGSVAVDDPEGGGASEKLLVTGGGFTITGRCQDFGGGDVEGSFVLDSPGTFTIHSFADGSTVNDLTGTTGEIGLMAFVENARISGFFMAFRDDAAGAIQGFAHGAVDLDTNACRFAVSATTN
jgi:hypothetical protein